MKTVSVTVQFPAFALPDWLSQEQINQIVQTYIDEAFDPNILAIKWCAEDVLEVAPDFTEEQVWATLQHIEQNHDATIGVNWDVIEYAADVIRSRFGG